LDHKWNRLSGLWSVKVYVNNGFISEEKFLIAENETELAELAVQVDTKDYSRQEKDQKIASIEKPKIIIKGEKVKIGIIEFQSLNEEAKKDNLGKIVSEMLTTSFVNSESFKIIEREQLQKVIKEFQLSQSGIIDTSYAKQIGKITGADAIVTGSVTKIGDDLRLDARIIDVESGIILTAEKSEGKINLKSIGMMTDRIVTNLVNKFYKSKK
jgi:TolB-like protein